MKILHVLNGDGTAYSFAQSGVPGDVVVWREMLSEGPLLANPRSDEELWTLREKWVTAQFGDRLTEDESYAQKVVAEFDTICQYANYDEVIFWFEHDLFCQINLVFLLACFARVDLGNTVLKQVSIHQFDGVPNFKGLGQLTAEQLASLYPKAEPLTTHELKLAARIWPAYATSDTAALTKLLSEDFGRLRYLREALQAHIARLQVGPNGLSIIQNQLLTLIQTAPKPLHQVVGEWLEGDRIYGLGDWSIENQLTHMKQLAIIQEKDGLLSAC